MAARPLPVSPAASPTTQISPTAWLFAWSQSTISVRFIGTQVAVRLQDVPLPTGGQAMALTITTSPSTTARHGCCRCAPSKACTPWRATCHKGRTPSRLVKRTEALVGTARFSGFDFGGDGHMLLAPKHPDRRILVIGDSISAGYGNEGPNEKCPFTPATENSDLAYGPVAARALGAEVQVIAWSGKGMYQNRDNSRQDVMPQLQTRVLPTQAGSVYDPNDYTPHAVVVNLGTNDFGHDLAPAEPFETAYYDFVMTLRRTYPTAYIVMALGPMLEDTEKNHHQLSAARQMLQAVSARLHQAQVTQVGFLEFPAQRGEHGFGCDYHPSLTTHAHMGAQLAATLKATLQWN